MSAEEGSVRKRAEAAHHGACQLGARCVRGIPPGGNRVEDTGTRAPFAGGRGTYKKVSKPELGTLRSFYLFITHSPRIKRPF